MGKKSLSKKSFKSNLFLYFFDILSVWQDGVFIKRTYPFIWFLPDELRM